ncbi:hypothetical protein [Flavobacterium dankookense]|uniref:C1q domain-containing protein n=1 Tax=Flavobacterium dankookense TaxID=706186 RepID=A0A4R6QF35_9FLAO|nr:hypothetical protein [Flavobacterium dankookense]TDP61141.1 hypothetical protein BC748_0754 [Flavobacterium dankookense]
MKKIILQLALVLTSAISFAQTGINTTTPKSTLDVNGSFGTKITEITDPNAFALDASHQTVVFRGTGGTIVIPTASTCLGREYTLVNFSSGFVQSGATLFDRGTGGINGIPTMTVFKIKSDGTKWIELTTETTTVATGSAMVNSPNVDLKPALKFFYMPSVSIDVSSPITGATKSLYGEYAAQFASPMIASSGSAGTIPFFDAPTDLEYYITYYDNTVLENVSISASGVLTYDVLSGASDCSFINIVFVVK